MTEATAAGLPDIILHGTATWALAGRELVARCADRDPTRLRRLRGCFRAMVIPGTAIELGYRVGRGRESLSPDHSLRLVVTRFIGSNQTSTVKNRMNAVTTNGP